MPTSIGNIGHWVTGKVPIRARGDGRIPAPGYSADHEWIGEVPFDKMPHALNPRRGLIVTTNQKLVSDRYPYALGKVYMNGYRARRIEQVLNSRPKVGPDDFRALQADYTCLPGLEFVALLRGFSTTDARAGLALELLGAWDGVLSAETIGGTVYEVTRTRLVRNLLEPGLGKELTTRVMGQGFHPVLLASHEFYGHDTVAMLRMLGDPKSWWVQQAGGRDKVLERSLIEAVEWLRATLGRETAQLAVGEDPSGAVRSPAGACRSRSIASSAAGRFPSAETPTRPARQPSPPSSHTTTARGRPRSGRSSTCRTSPARWSTTVPGQSGRLGSPHYDDRIEPWRKGEAHPMLWTRSQVEKELEGKLVLEP